MLQGRPGHDFASGGTAALPVLLDCALTIATSAAAAAGRSRSAAVVFIHNLAAGAFRFLVGRCCAEGCDPRERSFFGRRLGARVARRRAVSGHDSMTTFWRHWGAVLERVIEGLICAEFVVRGPTFRIASSAIF